MRRRQWKPTSQPLCSLLRERLPPSALGLFPPDRSSMVTEVVGTRDLRVIMPFSRTRLLQIQPGRRNNKEHPQSLARDAHLLQFCPSRFLVSTAQRFPGSTAKQLLRYEFDRNRPSRSLVSCFFCYKHALIMYIVLMSHSLSSESSLLSPCRISQACISVGFLACNNKTSAHKK